MPTLKKFNAVDMFRLWHSGAPCSEIALHFGTSSQQVYLAAKRYGLPRRSRVGKRAPSDPTPEEIRERAEAIKQKNLAAMRAKA